MIDPSSWVEEHLAGARKRGESWEADCPFCGKGGHLYVHGEDGYFTCFKCGESGRDLVKLLAEVEGITLKEARRRMFRDAVQFKQRPRDAAAAAGRLAALRESRDEPKVDTPPPATFNPVWDGKRWRMPRYLADRGVSRRLARKLGMGWCGARLCDDAPKACEFPEGSRLCTEYDRCRYAHRVVLPFSCPNGRSFTTRTTEPDAEPKYLNPPTPKGRLLYGWPLVEPGGDVVLVEGPFDAIRLAAHGLAALAVMGLSLSSAQRSLLTQLRPASITLMLDAGVETEAQGMAASVLGVGGAVYIAQLPAGLDPGDSGADQAWSAFRSAEEYRAGRGGFAAAIGRKLRAVTSEFTSSRAGDRLLSPGRGPGARRQE